MRASTTQPPADAGLLSAFDERVKRICAEMYREMSSTGDAGCVKVKTAARLLDMNESSVRQLIRDGELKVIRPTPNSIRIPLSEIRRYSEGEK
jgi:excisionase family DNA binding protein